VLARPDEDGDHMLRVIDSVWHKTRPSWRDDVAGHFEREHWSPLVAESRAYLGALRECLEMLGDAERDTDF
jgi:hypothetical protein